VFNVLKKAALFSTFVALAAPASWAQDPKIEIGATGAWTLSDGVSGDAIRAGDGRLYNSIEPKDSFAYSLSVGYFVNETISVGALFSQQKSKMVLGGSVAREVGDWSVNNYHGFVEYNSGAADSKARLYALGGLGATQYASLSFTAANGQARSIGGETKFSTTWGAGFKLYPTKSVGLRVGARWTPTYIKSDASGWWCDPYWGCYVTGNAQYANQFEFSGGLSLRF
jgi:hypothetical protein